MLLFCFNSGLIWLQVFTRDQEKALVEYIMKCSNLYYGLSILELRKLAYDFATKSGVKFPACWNASKTAGKDWYYSFMGRHRNLVLRTPEQTSLNRVKSFCRENVNAFFTQLDNILEEHAFPADCVWNMDETGFSTVATKVGKVISARGARKVGQMTGQERGTMVTMALAVNALGNSIPPFFLFPRKKMQSAFLDNASVGAVGYANSSGWMQQPEFVKYMEHFIQHSRTSTQSPTLLLIDNHASHLSVEALDLAAENGITILSFPPHCSHRLQPLDVSVYGPVKTYYKSQTHAWMRNHAGKPLEIRHITGIVKATLDLALTPRNIKSGFEKTGICPFNSDIFTDVDFLQTELSGENSAVAAMEANQNEQEQRRIVVEHDVPDVGAIETVSTSETATTSRASSHSSLLDDIGPLRPSSPKKKSNRGRKPLKSTVLTSPEHRKLLRDKSDKRNTPESHIKPKENAAKRQRQNKPKVTPPAKRGRKPKATSPSASRSHHASSSDEDVDFCIICLNSMPSKLNKNNSIACNTCKRAVHLKCADMTASFFTCKNCQSDEWSEGSDA